MVAVQLKVIWFGCWPTNGRQSVNVPLDHSISFDELSDRFRRKAILHRTVRLALIFRRKGIGPLWNVQNAMDFDRVGVGLGHVRRICRPSRAWSDELGDSASLTSLF